MTQRIGSSCALSPSMTIGKVAETRLILGNVTKCWEVVDKCIANKIYLIFNISINRNNNSGFYPSDNVWKTVVTDVCQKLKAKGGNRNNCRITLINEPMKYISKEQYAHLINLVYPIVHNYGFLCGAGNEQYTMANAHGNMYKYILDNCNFDILDVHLQGDCETDDNCKNIANIFKSWAVQYNKPVDCTEAFYSDIATSKGWNILKMQQYHSERIGCENFCMVFPNLDRSMFPWDTSDWDKLCFMINSKLPPRSGYWGQFLDLINAKSPVPNIKEEIMEYLRPLIQQQFYDAMNWQTPYHENTPSLPIVGRKTASTNITWADFDAVIETVLKGLITALKANDSLPAEFAEPMNIKYKEDGSWNNNWQDIAKSNPK